MKKVLLILLLIATPLLASNLRRFQIEDLSNPQNAEKNEIALNSDFEDLWIYKQDITTTKNPTLPQYRIKDLGDPSQAEYNAMAINLNFQDLYTFKLGISSPTKVMDRLVEDILNPAKADENTAIINGLFDDLWADKIDK